MSESEASSLREQLELAHQQNMAYQQMLAHALSELGKELRINQNDLTSQKFQGYVIDLQEDIAADQFVLRLVAPKSD